MPKICPVCNASYPDANAFCLVDGTTLHAADLGGDLIGSVVADRYLVTDLLGEGGMGKVYLARHVRLPQQAAIKVLRPELVRDPGAIARFNREASNASRIDDDHVAHVYDFGETSDGTVYLAMEYVAGRTLRDILTTDAPLSPRRTATLIGQIAEGLDAAHRLRIIHRDLKPDNVLVVETPEGRDRVKVVDFGIAKAFGANEGKLTQTGFVLGTPAFMSPEQLLGESLDARSDVYAIALIAYECLTAALPFDTTTPARAMTSRLTDGPRPLRESRPDVGWAAPVQAVFDRGLARHAVHRPATAGDFARQLAEAFGLTSGTRVREAATIAPEVQTVNRPASGAAPRSRTPVVVGVSALGVLAVGAALRGSGVLRRAEPPVRVSAAPLAPASPPALPHAADTTARPPAEARVEPRVAARPTASSTSRATEPEARTRSTEGSAEAADAAYAASQSLDSLSRALQQLPDAAGARRIASALRALIPRLAGQDRTRGQLRLIDASTLSGDLTGACAALSAARASASTAGLRADVRKSADQLGCSD
jgi:serine/threonine protein kinase